MRLHFILVATCVRPMTWRGLAMRAVRFIQLIHYCEQHVRFAFYSRCYLCSSHDLAGGGDAERLVEDGVEGVADDPAPEPVLSNLYII